MPRRKLKDYYLKHVESLELKTISLAEEIAELKALLVDGPAKRIPRGPRKMTEEGTNRVKRVIEVLPHFVRRVDNDWDAIAAKEIRFILKRFYNITVSNIQLAKAIEEAYGITSKRMVNPLHRQSQVAVCYPGLSHHILTSDNPPPGSDEERWEKYQTAIYNAGLWGN